ncbi:DNA alkylation repair protein [Helicobacter sp. MIT 05-5294]|uniref:DNA alkylation repair protein n=1 Tax=Helicobacter sp. MIT 05-5294 TaxID=1548150 RepID=UPI0010FD43B4|nr:DNA alkylation repair protein [Helicobacter sp. MIT 05-5294]TLD87230.1 DNA alkylation repair protein [Helicobacter sp. MIT 05-5294]
MKHKEHYNDTYILDLSQKILAVMPEFEAKTFVDSLLGKLDDKELFARFDCIVDAMQKSMSDDYSKNIEAFFKILGEELSKSEGMFQFGWWLWPIGRYVERCGNENWRLSLAFCKELTKRFTGEYAIRPLLKEHPKEVMDELIQWSLDSNVHVRRLASEGVRIRLPWSQKLFVALDEFEKYTTLLTNLKDDSEKFVQKSVGNNLNDLYKDAPDKADYIIAQWEKSGNSKAQMWIIKHARRNQK